MQCVVFENTCYYTKLQGKSNFFLPIMYMKKNHKKSGQTNFDSVHSSYLYFAFVLQLCTHVTTLHSCYNFAFMLHENALLFSPSEMHHFLLAKKLWYCVGGVCFQRHCDVSSRYSKTTRFYQLT